MTRTRDVYWASPLARDVAALVAEAARAKEQAKADVAQMQRLALHLFPGTGNEPLPTLERLVDEVIARGT
jgi:hypothetical protein